MAVLTLVPHDTADNDTADALQALWQLACDGKCAGISVTYMEPGGAQNHVCTGVYWDRPAEAVRAALRASIILTKHEEETRGPP